VQHITNHAITVATLIMRTLTKP